MQGYGFKLISVAALLIISVWQLFPTLQNSLNNRDLAAMDEAQRAAYLEEHGDDIQATSEEALKLGLDLQGGMHVTLEVGTGALLRELAGTRADDTFDAALAVATEQAETSNEDFVTLFSNAVEAERPGTRLARYFRNTAAEITARSENDDVEAYLRTEVEEALVRAEEIIRQRIDRFGVTEPLIQRQGSSRIVVELPGVDDETRVRDLLKGTAKLTFHLTPPTAEIQQAAAQIFAYYQNEAEEAGTDTTATADSDSTAVADADTAAAVDLSDITAGADAVISAP